MRAVIRNILIICFVCFPILAKGQTHEAGAIIGVEYEKKVLKGLHFGLDGQLRFNQNFTNFDRLRIGAGLDYSFWKKRLKVGAAGFYLLGDKGNYFEHRGRIQGTLAYTERIQQFKIGVRARVQSTFYDERRGDHKFNPKTYFRGRLQFEYDFFGKPLKIFASTEFFLRLYKKDNCFIDNFRTIAGIEYRLTQGSSLTFSFRSENEIQMKNPENIYYFCIGYNFKH